MKSVRNVLLGVLVLGVLCCSLLATAPQNLAPTALGNTVFLGTTTLDEDISAEDSHWIPLGIATIYTDPLDNPDTIALGDATLYD